MGRKLSRPWSNAAKRFQRQCCPARGPHAARRLISCGPPVLAKFVRNLGKKIKQKTKLELTFENINTNQVLEIY